MYKYTYINVTHIFWYASLAKPGFFVVNLVTYCTVRFVQHPGPYAVNQVNLVNIYNLGTEDVVESIYRCWS